MAPRRARQTQAKQSLTAFRQNLDHRKTRNKGQSPASTRGDSRSTSGTPFWTCAKPCLTLIRHPLGKKVKSRQGQILEAPRLLVCVAHLTASGSWTQVWPFPQESGLGQCVDHVSGTFLARRQSIQHVCSTVVADGSGVHSFTIRKLESPEVKTQDRSQSVHAQSVSSHMSVGPTYRPRRLR